MMDATVFALLDDASPEGHAQARSRLYEGYAGVLACQRVDDWPRLLDGVQDALARGLHAVPVLTYELGEQLLGIAPARESHAPLAQVLLFERYTMLDAAQVDAWLAASAHAGPAGIGAVRASVDEAAFAQAIERIRAYIAAGDTYQVNYTYRLRFDAFGDARPKLSRVSRRHARAHARRSLRRHRRPPLARERPVAAARGARAARPRADVRPLRGRPREATR
jgi:para-aminobenzoate synthetase/4-amino-4-deoxychorismate lyase